MIDVDQLRRLVETRLIERGGKHRYDHIAAVEALSAQLAQTHGVDVTKARIAAILHDATKFDPEAEHLRRIERTFGLSESSKWPKALWHCLSAVDFAIETGVDDVDIQNAILYHGSGRKAMSKLEMILYVADYAEPTRHFENAAVRELAFQSLEKAMLVSLREIAEHEKTRGHDVLPLADEAAAYYQSVQEGLHD
jgi:predicted HD superfamily hydrolase involved in NAD metabolism